MIKRNLLFLCQTLPFPPDGGVHIRTFNMLRLLSEEFEITALCFYRAATRSTPEAVKAGLRGLGELSAPEAFHIPQERSLVRLVWDHVRSLTRRRPYTVFAYDSAAFRERLKELLESGDFDIVHVDSLDLSRYLPVVAAVPTVCGHHNVESELLRGRAAAEKRFWRRWYLRHQADLLEEEEGYWCPRVELNTAVSERDRERFLSIAPTARFEVVPNGVDTDYFQPSPRGDSERLVFVGGLSWFPNSDALRYFAAEIWPRIRQQAPQVSVSWVGRASADVRRAYHYQHGIELTGYVEDIRPHVEAAAVYIVPLRVGGGTRLKVLDAWAMGKAVVSTSIGCEGLHAVDGRNILIRDDPQEFANAVIQLIANEKTRRQIGASARCTAEELYSWDVVGARMLPHYRRLTSRVNRFKSIWGS